MHVKSDEPHTTCAAGNARTVRSKHGLLLTVESIIDHWCDSSKEMPSSLTTAIAQSVDELKIDSLVESLGPHLEVPEDDVAKFEWIVRLRDSRQARASVVEVLRRIVREKFDQLLQNLSDALEPAPLAVTQLLESSHDVVRSESRLKRSKEEAALKQAARIHAILKRSDSLPIPGDVRPEVEQSLSKSRKQWVDRAAGRLLRALTQAQYQKAAGNFIVAIQKLNHRAHVILQRCQELNQAVRSKVQLEGHSASESLGGRAVALRSLPKAQFIETLIDSRGVNSLAEVAAALDGELVEELKSGGMVDADTRHVIAALDRVRPDEVIRRFVSMCEQAVAANSLYEVLDNDALPSLVRSLWRKAEPLGGPIIHNGALGVCPDFKAVIGLPKPRNAGEAVKRDTIKDLMRLNDETRVAFYEVDEMSEISVTRIVLGYPGLLDRHMLQLRQAYEDSISRGAYPHLVDFPEQNK